MTTSTRVPVEEYLSTDYSPDVDYVDGELVDRNVGEKDHSKLQMRLAGYLFNHRAEYGIHIFPEPRLQVSPSRFRVPYISVVVGPEPEEQIFTTPPFLCIEILSPEDRMSRVQNKIDDLLGFGVRYLWIVDPNTRHAWVHTRDAIAEARDGFLWTKHPDIAVPLSEILEQPAQA
jgi:Uma2 family endonuclease